MLLQTEVKLGDCSYLNTCHHMDTCKFVHYEFDENVGGDIERPLPVSMCSFSFNNDYNTPIFRRLVGLGCWRDCRCIEVVALSHDSILKFDYLVTRSVD